VTAYFQKHGLDGGDLPEIPKPDYRANPGVAGGSEKTEPSADALDRAIERACKLAQHSASMPKVVADLAYGLVKDDLRGLKAGNGRDWPDLPRLPSGRFTPQIREKEPSELRTITAEFGSSRHVEPSNINELASSG
jgi:hypothetical protein